jgi:hypothetical protein
VGVGLLYPACGTHQLDQPVVPGQASEGSIPVCWVERGQGLGQAGNGLAIAQGVRDVRAGRTVEEPEQAQDGELASARLAVLEPAGRIPRD